MLIPFRWMLSILSLLCVLGAHVQGADSDHLVFAHYMPCFPPTGVDPHDDYWYQAQFDPDIGGSRPARPLLADDDPHGCWGEQGYIDDIRIAKTYGIDGFFVDLLDDNDRYLTNWTNLIRAAERVGGFFIAVMPDYATLMKKEDDPVLYAKIKHWLTVAGTSPALWRYAGRPAVVPYAVSYPDGRLAPQEKDMLDWFTAQGLPISYMSTHGLGWPMYSLPYAHDPHTGFQTFAFGVGTFSPGSPIKQRQLALDYWPSSLPQMSEDSFLYYNRGWRYSSDRLSASYRKYWEWTIQHRDRYRWIELITWNDWNESGMAPSCNHSMVWQRLTRYYATWFKTGVKPTITTDGISILHRPHPASSKPSAYPFQMKDTEPADEVEALAMLSAPATLVLTTGTTEFRSDVGAGIQSMIRPFSLGIQKARIERHGTVIAEVESPVPISDHPARQNLWFIGADSAHPPRAVSIGTWRDISGEWTGRGRDRSGTGLCLTGTGYLLTDTIVQATVVPGTIVPGSRAGIVVHAVEDRAQDSLGLDLVSVAGNPGWELIATRKGVESVLAHGPAIYASGKPVVLRLVCAGEYVSVYIDGTLQTTTSEYKLPYGAVGLQATGAPCSFTGFSCSDLDPDWTTLGGHGGAAGPQPAR